MSAKTTGCRKGSSLVYLFDVVELVVSLLLKAMSLDELGSPPSRADKNPVLTLFLIFLDDDGCTAFEGEVLGASWDRCSTSGVTTGFFFLFVIHPFRADNILAVRDAMAEMPSGFNRDSTASDPAHCPSTVKSMSTST